MFRFCSIPVGPQTCQQSRPSSGVSASRSVPFAARSGPLLRDVSACVCPHRAAIVSPRVGGSICAEPLDDESHSGRRQSGIKHPLTMNRAFQTGDKPATRGPGLSRDPCNPQTESVKKYMGSESFESIRESFARRGVRLLRPSMSDRLVDCQGQWPLRIVPAAKLPVRETTGFAGVAGSRRAR